VSGLTASGTAYLTRVLVEHQLGMEAVGIYTATWMLSSYYAGFVLTAMGTDFLPRLTAASHDNATMNRLVNEQTEMGIVIAIPGVLATLALTPLVMKVFYSSAFVDGAEMARWQILGVFLRVVSWPLSYLLIARGKSALFAVTELAFGAVNVVLISLCMNLWQLEGVGVSFALSYVFYTIMLAVITSWVTGFCWTGTALKLLIPALLILVTIFGCTRLLPERWSIAIGLVATAVVGTASFLKLQHMLRVDLWQAIHRTLHQSNNAAITKTESKNALLSTKAEFPEKDII